MTPSSLDFLAGGGELGARMRALDWSATAVGPAGTWPQSLRTAVRVVLSSQHPMFVWWGPGLTQFYNDAYSRTMGPEKHPAALGGSGHDWWPEAWSIIGPQIQSVMSGGSATWHEDQMVPIRRHGSEEAVYWTYGFSPIDDETAPNGIGGVLVVCRDVTEERRLRGMLAVQREDERRRRLIIEGAVDYAIIALDRAGRVTDWNTGATHLLGWCAEEMRGETLDCICTPEDRAEDHLRRELREALEFGRARDERQHVRKNGSRFWASCELMLVRDDLGAPYGFIKIVRDITERKQAEAALLAFNATLERRVEARTRELHDSRQRTRLALSVVNSIGTWDWDVPNDRIYADAALAGLLGVDPAAAATGAPAAEFFVNVHSDDADAVRQAFARVLHAGGDCAITFRVERPDHPLRWILARGHCSLASDGAPHRLPGVAIDISEQRSMEEQLRQAQKMEAVGQLTGGLAHDFNNLLTGIIGSLELLQTRVAQGRVADVGRYVEAAQGAATRAAGLTHRLLAFSRQQTLDPKATDVNRLVGGMEDLIRRTVGPEILVRTVVEGALWNILVDPGQLENALLNLCINARDAMPDGGTLSIETANQAFDDQAARAHEIPPGHYVLLCVSDNGSGMPADVVARAFDPFFTTKPMGLGTGLGLSMIYGFTRQSGGRAGIRSEVGQGTTVSLYLPRHVGDAHQAPLAALLSDAPRAEQGETVLVVDDEPTIRMLVAEVLEDLGYVAIEAADGAAGLKVLRSDTRIDLLVTDVGLPGGMNGRQVADAARTVRPDLKVLFITGYAENAVLDHGTLDHGMHVMAKPFAMEGLASRIRNLIADGG